MTLFKIPEIPSDSLYKFLALSGFSMILLGFYRLNLSIDVISLLTVFCGIALSTYGFYNWYIKVQKPQDKIIQDSANKLNIQKSITIHELQFKKEFEIYQTLWKSLIELKRENEVIYSIIKDYESFDKQKIEDTTKEINERSKSFWSKYNNFTKIYEDNKPFYPKTIFCDLEKIEDLSSGLFIEGTILDVFQVVKEIGINKNFTETFNSIINLIETVCTTIRERIELTNLKE